MKLTPFLNFGERPVWVWSGAYGRSRWAWVALAVAVVCLALSALAFWKWQGLNQSNQLLSARVSELHGAARTAGSAPARTAVQARTWRDWTYRMNTPWSSRFEALERHAAAGVKLVALRTEKSLDEWLLTVEGRDQEALNQWAERVRLEPSVLGLKPTQMAQGAGLNAGDTTTTQTTYRLNWKPMAGASL